MLLFCRLPWAVFVLVVPVGKDVLQGMSNGVNKVINYSNVGIEFLFGNLADTGSFGFIFVVKVLPIIIFASALMAVLYHLHIMQWVVKIFGGALHKIIGTKRVESLCAAANIFLGQTEAPLVIRPYLGRISDAQFFHRDGVGAGLHIGGPFWLAMRPLGSVWIT